jgi:hypothetical protein
MSDKQPSIDPIEVLHYIKTLAATAQESTNMDVVQEHIEMILTLVDKRCIGTNRKPGFKRALSASKTRFADDVKIARIELSQISQSGPVKDR